MAFAVLFAASACAVGGQLETIEGELTACELVSFDGDLIKTKAALAAGPTSQPIESVYRWGSPAEPGRRPMVHLAGGSRLVAAPTWTLDGPIELEGDRLTLRQMLLDDAELPRTVVRRIDFAAARDPAGYAEVIREAKVYRGGQDRAWLTSGDTLTGAVETIRGGRLSMRVGEQSVELPVDRVAVLKFASSERAPTKAPSVKVGLADGGLLIAHAASSTAEGKIDAELTAGASLTGVRPGAVTLVQPVSGRVTPLSSLSPLDYRHTPYFDLAWPFVKDANLFGGPLTSGGVRWLDGLAMHSASRLVYRVPTGAKRLVGSVALDDTSAAGDGGPGGSVVFRVLVARTGFEPAWQSPTVRTGDPPLPLSIDVTGAKAIALLVEHADRGDTLDHADWLGLRFVE